MIVLLVPSGRPEVGTGTRCGYWYQLERCDRYGVV